MAFESGKNFVGFVVATFTDEKTRGVWKKGAKTPDESGENYPRSVPDGKGGERTYRSGMPMEISMQRHLVQKRNRE
jgi:hypothetical protein